MMNTKRFIASSVATVAAFSLVLGSVDSASAASPVDTDSLASQATNDEGVTHGELYDTLKRSSLKAEDTTVDGQTLTTFSSKDGISLTVPKPTNDGGGVGPQLSGKINKNGEPVIYLNQKDQKKIKSVGKAAIGGLLALLPAGKVTKFLSGALGASVADFIGSNGICKSGKSLRITGTPGGDAIKEIKCV